MSATRADVDRFADTTGDALLVSEGFDHCIVGIAQQFNSTFVVYDRAKVIQTLVKRDGMSEDDAEEYFDVNIIGGWLGPHTPAYLWRHYARKT